MLTVTSQSARVSRTRPFYARHAQAYDLLVADPVEPWVEAVHERLVRSGWPAAPVLDAGCGTGRHAAALTALGHRVDLADAADGLLRQASARCPGARTFHADLCSLNLAPAYQAVTCRGVLNDILGDTDRDAVLRSFGAALRPGGLLVRGCPRATGITRPRGRDAPTADRATHPGHASGLHEHRYLA